MNKCIQCCYIFLKLWAVKRLTESRTCTEYSSRWLYGAWKCLSTPRCLAIVLCCTDEGGALEWDFMSEETPFLRASFQTLSSSTHWKPDIVLEWIVSFLKTHLDAGWVEEALLSPGTSSALSTWAGAPPLSAVWLAELMHRDPRADAQRPTEKEI